MKSIEILIKEHENILLLTRCLEKACSNLIENDDFSKDDFYFFVEFGKVYGDKLHHQKEEDILFTEMENTLGPTAKKLIRTGMYVEHDLGRLYLSNILNVLDKMIGNKPTTADKLDIIGNSIAYRDLLNRHIDKENNAVYTFAANNLSKESKIYVESESEKFDNAEEVISERNLLLENLNNLSKKLF